MTELAADWHTGDTVYGARESESDMARRWKHCSYSVLLPASAPKSLDALQDILLCDEQEENEEAIERVDQVKDEEEEVVLK